MEDELTRLRGEIDGIDAELAALFLRRMEVTRRVGEYKAGRGMQVLDDKREKEVLAKKTALVDGEAQKADITTLFETIMAISRRQQRTLVTEDDPWYDGYLRNYQARRAPVSDPRVLYQGEPGAYAEEAAVRFFGEGCRRSNLPGWEDLFSALSRGDGDYAVVPIENSSTGAISQVYDLLARYGAFLAGEQTVPVSHCLMAVKGAGLDTVREVRSHEQGLFQCGDFLKAHPDWTTRAVPNTALAAKSVAESGDRTLAAIGSPRAAALYGLEILAEGVNTEQGNTTRFVVVSPVMELREGRDKISVQFTLAHRSGTLHRMLTVFAVNSLNLMKLESRPIPGRNWEYSFFADFSGDLSAPGMDGVLRELSQSAQSFRILGNYKGSTL